MSETNRRGSVVEFPSGGSVQHQPYQPEVRLPRRGVSPVVLLFLALPFLLYWLATVAFTPAGMAQFEVGLGQHVGWLIGSSDGNRVATFALLGVGIVGTVGFLKHLVVRHYGLGVFGWGQVALGVTLLCGVAGEWHLGRVGLILAFFVCWGGYIFIVWGWRNIQNDQGAAFAPQFQAAELPEQDIYGRARAATDEEIHDALRDKPRVNNGGYRYRE